MIAIINGKIHTMTGVVYEGGSILIDEGIIVDVGVDIEIPDDATIIDAKGKMVTPGIVDPHSHLGLGEEGIGFEGRDYNEATSPSTPHMRSIDGIYPMDNGLIEAYQGGVTSAVVAPGSANAIGGSVVAIKTYGTRVDDMVIKDPVAIKFALGENIKRFYGANDKAPMTRMGIASIIREELYAAKDYLNKKKEGKDIDYSLRYEALIPVLKREIPAKIHAHRSDDIFTAIRIAKEFEIDITLDHCTEGHIIADALAEEGYPCILGPNLSSASKYELKNRSFVTPAKLYEAGAKIAIMTDNPVIPSPQITICAGLAHRSGLPEEEALKAITINAAEITGIDDRVGSIKKGKDGDVVVWTGNPITDIDNEVECTIINGKVVYQRGRDSKQGF